MTSSIHRTMPLEKEASGERLVGPAGRYYGEDFAIDEKIRS